MYVSVYNNCALTSFNCTYLELCGLLEPPNVLDSQLKKNLICEYPYVQHLSKNILSWDDWIVLTWSLLTSSKNPLCTHHKILLVHFLCIGIYPHVYLQYQLGYMRFVLLGDIGLRVLLGCPCTPQHNIHKIRHCNCLKDNLYYY